ncbi:MAG: hypothetical protein U5L11_17850 [Arhodomonas sp.]|nr:hypothetical protein [Arhodomonas sp.]
MEDRIEALARSLRDRGIAADEVDTICGFVAYIDGVDAIDETLLDADLPLAYEPATGAAGEGGA